jgi:hypothetical protein
MKRMLRFVFIVAAMLAYYFAYTVLLSPILEQILYEGVDLANESAMINFALVMQAFAAIIFIVLYINWYIATPRYKREFLRRLETVEYNMKADIVHYIEENNGNIDVLIYGAYSALLPLSLWFFGGASPIAFLYFHQLVFYNIGFTDIFAVNLAFGYMCSILFFIMGYISGVALLHKRWHKNRLKK